MKRWVAVMLLAGMPVVGVAGQSEESQQQVLIERVGAISDACQQQWLMQGIHTDLARDGYRLPLTSLPGDDVLSRFAWQQHLLYVFAGLAEQWTLASWAREGAAVAAQLRAGTLGWQAAQPTLRQWENVGQNLEVSPPQGECAAGIPRKIKRLREDVSSWIVNRARNGVPAE